MLCKFPTVFPNSPMPAPCKRCVHCLINRRDVWATRMLCESMHSSDNSFLTVTFNDEHLPADLSLDPDTHRLFMYRFRDRLSYHFDRKVRFYMAGEYGEKNGRPHYHYALFGFPHCPYGGGRTIGGQYRPCQCSLCSFCKDAWGFGDVFLGSLTSDSAKYVAKYITNGLSRPCSCSKYFKGSDWHHPKCSVTRLQGRHPEFSRQSNQPGIGAVAIPAIKDILTRYDIKFDDLPNVMLQTGKPLPLGKYMKDKILDEIGICLVPGMSGYLRWQELRTMFKTDEYASSDAAKAFFSLDVAEAERLLSSQRVVDVEARMRMYKKEVFL